MKKLLLLLFFTGILFSCGGDKSQEDETAKYCWVFNIKQVTSISGASVPGYPQTITTKHEQCELSEVEAQKVVEKLTTTTTATESGIKVTVRTTATKTKK